MKARVTCNQASEQVVRRTTEKAILWMLSSQFQMSCCAVVVAWRVQSGLHKVSWARRGGCPCAASCCRGGQPPQLPPPLGSWGAAGPHTETCAAAPAEVKKPGRRRLVLGEESAAAAPACGTAATPTQRQEAPSAAMPTLRNSSGRDSAALEPHVFVDVGLGADALHVGPLLVRKQRVQHVPHLLWHGRITQRSRWLQFQLGKTTWPARAASVSTGGRGARHSQGSG